MRTYVNWFLSGLLLVSASVASAESEQERLVRETVSKNVAELLTYFNDEKQYYETDPQRFFSNMDRALTKIVDFRRIAARVMGKYARRANKEQRDRFVDVFKTSLFDTYSKTLIESGTFEIRVLKATLNSRSDKRASVDLEVVSKSGSVYPVVYSMYLTDEGHWLMENVIVFGVNVGLAFRDRFENQMRSTRGNIDAVIDGWNVKLEIDQPQGQGAAS
ncbi:MAG: ABC transporter substrate-binding protein [Oleiphilaceae bacterium]|nr:ABC transporter substrate-binding protein [Oleiphilaceae bacterium]